MSAVLPDPVPLDLPEEDPAAVTDAATAVSGAAFRLGVLGARLTGPAATAPGWLGADAAAAGEQIVATATLVRDVHDALGAAERRLSSHAGVVAETRRRILALRAQQEEDFAAAGARLADLLSVPPSPPAPAHPPPVVALADELRAADAARSRRHAALLSELRADAVAAARALDAATAVVGGTGRRDDGPRVLATLAARLPGWGDGELAARGADLARLLAAGADLPAEEAIALGAESYAGSRAFADALLTVLGPGGVRHVLFLFADQGVSPDSSWARLVALALGAAQRSGSVMDRVGEVLDAGGGEPTRSRWEDDFVAVGMATVLAAGATLAAGGVPASTAAAWGRQVLVREQELRGSSPVAYRAVDRTAGGRFPRIDPVTEVLRVLARADDPAASAVLLGDRRCWAALLGRPLVDYGDGAADLATVVQQAAGLAAGGEAVVRAGLAALGTGLADGDPGDWPGDRRTAAALSVPLARAVAGHPDLTPGLLLPAADGSSLDGIRDAALWGLGYLSMDPGAAALVGGAVGAWAVDHASAMTDPGAARGAPAPAAPLVVGSFVAVREYGQRLAYALHGYEMRDDALARQALWNGTVGLVLNLLPRNVGAVAGAVEPFAAHLLGTDGTWDVGRDGGPTFEREDAIAAVQARLGAAPIRTAELFAAHAGTAFDRTSQLLGRPRPPESPEWQWWQAALDGLPLPDLRDLLPQHYLRQHGVPR